ncbi:hypothetical protein [Paenibacillus agricola]|uniref:Uncharacterized protein n=1 Tax=Paenibacillus agricola TaxID=2716264 RepID=A0ABX0J4G3_9BACL|nr:hypothetical protein [Paenibacillus agricola]NHN31184.1 hypothetical protein [Paenibacillus agricola]
MSDVLKKKINSMIKRAKDPTMTDDVRFSLTTNRMTNARLEFVRKELKLSKQEFLMSIIQAALTDVEVELGLLTARENGIGFDFTETYHKGILEQMNEKE